MHQHSLYQFSKSKSDKFFNLVEALPIKADSPRKLELCTALIASTATRWRDEGLLVKIGKNFVKSAALRKAWTECPDLSLESPLNFMNDGYRLQEVSPISVP